MKGRIARGKRQGNQGDLHEDMGRNTDREDMSSYHSDDGYSTDSTSSSSDLGLQDATTNQSSSAGNGGKAQDGEVDENGVERGGKSRDEMDKKGKKQVTKSDKKDLHRKQRGLMQWKPMRNLKFAKDEAIYASRKVVGKGKLEGREPTVESEY